MIVSYKVRRRYTRRRRVYNWYYCLVLLRRSTCTHAFTHTLMRSSIYQVSFISQYVCKCVCLRDEEIEKSNWATVSSDEEIEKNQLGWGWTWYQGVRGPSAMRTPMRMQTHVNGRSCDVRGRLCRQGASQTQYCQKLILVNMRCIVCASYKRTTLWWFNSGWLRCSRQQQIGQRHTISQMQPNCKKTRAYQTQTQNLEMFSLVIKTPKKFSLVIGTSTQRKNTSHSEAIAAVPNNRQ